MPRQPQSFRGRGPIIRLGRRGLGRLLIGVLLLASHIAAAGEWGHKLPGLPTQFVFGYGSLIDADSRGQTAGVIDKLLKHTAPVSQHFNDRLFPEVFAATRLAEPGMSH
jgi:hypothetical protein